MIPANLILETNKVILRPISMDDKPDLLAIAQQDPDMWSYYSVNLADADEMTLFIETALKESASGVRRPFTIIEKSTGKITGSSSMGNITYPDQRLEIGWSWIGKDFRSTGINRHAKYAMMKHAFEVQHFERVEFKTDVLNLRAREGLRKVGGIEEGILRSHMKMWNNRRRTSIFYSVLKDEFPLLKSTIFKGFD
jgi:N-acetyltransferase